MSHASFALKIAPTVVFAFMFLPMAVQTGEIGRISGAVLAERIKAGDAPVILDVRSAKEYSQGHVPGAVNLPYEQLRNRLAALPEERNTELVIYCYSGRRAAIARRILLALGYTHVKDLDGHWRAWRSRNNES